MKDGYRSFGYRSGLNAYDEERRASKCRSNFSIRLCVVQAINILSVIVVTQLSWATACSLPLSRDGSKAFGWQCALLSGRWCVGSRHDWSSVSKLSLEKEAARDGTHAQPQVEPLNSTSSTYETKSMTGRLAACWDHTHRATFPCQSYFLLIFNFKGRRLDRGGIMIEGGKVMLEEARSAKTSSSVLDQSCTKATGAAIVAEQYHFVQPNQPPRQQAII